jgi:cytochrome c553
VRSFRLLVAFICLTLYTFTVSAGDPVAGEARYKQSCINCHGMAGKGAASYPKISGKEVSYVTAMLETYRDGIEVGPNSSLMIMMAQPLTDVEIANLAAYLKDAVYQQPK